MCSNTQEEVNQAGLEYLQLIENVASYFEVSKELARLVAIMSTVVMKEEGVA